MRHIDNSSIGASLPDGWQDDADAALLGVEGKTTSAEKSEEVNRHADVWRGLKRKLAGLSSKKCWYCESPNVRSDNAVDHYRPKNAVDECSGHEGYWWLAFRWENYRFSCTYCNSKRKDVEHGTTGGKHDHFPLLDESCRARCPADDCDREQPMLLDPCCAADPVLLWFDEDGQPRANPTHCGDKNGYAFKRVEKSIELYHLRHPDVVEARLRICSSIRKDIDDADRMLQKAGKGDMTARDAFATAVRQISARLAASSAYSMTARCMLLGLRANSAAANAVLQSA